MKQQCYRSVKHMGGWMLVPASISAVGSIAKGQSEKQAANGQAASQNYDAQIADQNAAMSYAQGSQQEETQRRQARQTLGEQRAAIAESGTGFSGSNADVMRQSATNAELDAMNIRYGADVQALGYKNQATSSRFNAKLSKNSGKAAAMAGYLSGASTLASSAISNYGTGK